MLDETRTFESDTEQVSSRRVVRHNKHTRSKPRQKKPAAAKAELTSTREIILRLIELFREA